MSEKHKEVLTALIYFIEQNKEFALVCGDVGTGKTMILNQLMHRLPASVQIIAITYSDIEHKQLIQYLAKKLAIQNQSGSLLEIMDDIKTALMDAKKNGRRTVLIVDEAHLLPNRTLDHIRLLSNLETNEEKLMQIVLVGQNELSTKLDQPEMRQLRQRININRFLMPLDAAETTQYIDHRLQVVGSNFESCFEPNCSKTIYKMTKGIPRLINHICDNALLICQIYKYQKINKAILRKADAAIGADRLFASGSVAKRSTFKNRKSVTTFSYFLATLAVIIMLVLFFGYRGYLQERIKQILARRISTQESPADPSGDYTGPPAIAEPNAAQDSPAGSIAKSASGTEKVSLKIPNQVKPVSKDTVKAPFVPQTIGRTHLPETRPPTEQAGVEKSMTTEKSDQRIPPDVIESEVVLSHRTSPSMAFKQAPGSVQSNPLSPDRKYGEVPLPPVDRQKTQQAVGSAEENNSRQARQERRIVVKTGDTLGKIAAQWFPDQPKIGLEAILDANPFITNRDLLVPGQTLTIPIFNGKYQTMLFSNGRYYALFNTYQSIKELNKVMSQLIDKNITYEIRNTKNSNGVTCYEVILGGYKNVEDLIRFLQLAKESL